MENNSGLVQDAIKTAIAIVNSITPYNKWVIVNIGKTPNLTFTYPTIPVIPTCFGYNYDKVPELFETDGVIEAKIEKRWFVKLTKSSYDTYAPPVYEKFDFITKTARVKNYFDKDTRADYYNKEPGVYRHGGGNYGPEIPGQYAVLINVDQLRRFMGFYSGSVPLYYISNKCLFYRGNKLTIDGEVEGKLVDILIKNYNSIVPKEIIYKYIHPSGKEYAKNKTFADDSIKSSYKRIEKKFNKDTFFGPNFLLAQKRGFGIFVVQPYQEEVKPQEAK